MANAQASLATGKAVNTASLVSANDAAVPDKQSVEYFRASRDASIVTTPLLHGVKNEIVLASYGGNNTYSFVVELNGLEPAESTGDSIPLLDENGALKAYINIEELRDAEGKVSLQNRIDIAPYAEDGKYLVMVTLDEAFMTDPQTVYPLSATSPASVYGDDINDADVNSGSPSKNYASSSTLWVGYINGAVYRSYLQFIIGEYSDDIAPNSISNAYMILYEKSGNTSTFSMQSRIPSNIWNYTSLTWNNQPGYWSTFNGVSAPSNVPLTQTSTMYRVYMTAYVQACMRNYVSQALPRTIHEQRGLMLKIADETSAQVRMFNSTNASSNKPTLVVTYKPDYYGGAFPYYYNGSNGTNCLGYAIRRAEFISPKSNSYLDTVTGYTTGTYFTSCVRPYLNSIGRTNRVVGRTDVINANEYRIAMRTHQVNYEYGYPIGADYHFVVENSSGLWAHKPGQTVSTQIYATDNPQDDECGWHVTGDFYYEDTIYIAISNNY